MLNHPVEFTASSLDFGP